MIAHSDARLPSDLRHLDLHHLADLLGKRHLAEQISDPRLDRRGRVEVGRPAGGGER